MGQAHRGLRDHLARSLAWGDAHVTFDAAVAGLPPRLRGVVPPGLPHSAWQLVEHIRLAQADILEFGVSRRYREKQWPADYWPRSAAPPRRDAWMRAIAAVRRDRRALERLVRDSSIDLEAGVPSDPDKTFLREVLLLADHTAYHVGQLILVRRALGAWT
ncbi:MAG TPA: DinB family protein [Vicinamibacterales bacterium]|nr:DinB family protein [Vicinamibacterales bacterium]